MSDLDLKPFETYLEDRFASFTQDDPLLKWRKTAWDEYRKLGLPTKSCGSYQYIKLRHIYGRSYETKQIEQNSKQQNALVFLNGCFQQTASQPTGLEKIVILPLNEASKTYSTFLKNQWTKGLEEEGDPLTLLNHALHPEGVFIYVPPNTVLKEPIKIVHEVTEANLCFPRIHLFVGKLAEISILHTTNLPDSFAIQGLMEINLEEGARVHIDQFALNGAPQGSPQGWHFEAVRASLKRDSFLKMVNIQSGSQASRTDYRIALKGEQAEAHLYGLAKLQGKNEAHIHVLMDHQAPHCRSNQTFKNVLQDNSHASFEGKIYVHPEAQKTEAFQLNNNLLLSEHAQAESKPNLEIFADDVKASHGATFGQIDHDQVFYLTTRGLPVELAQSLVIAGFCDDILCQLKNKSPSAQW